MLGLFKDGRKVAVDCNEMKLLCKDPTSSANDDKRVVWFQVTLGHLAHVLPRHWPLPRSCWADLAAGTSLDLKSPVTV